MNESKDIDRDPDARRSGDAEKVAWIERKY